MISSDSIPVILNPAARSSQAGGHVEKVQALSPRIDLRLTGGPGDACRIAKECADEGHPIVVGVGGDGTVNEVTRGLAQSKNRESVELGVIPAGTMNVLARELEIPVDFRSAWKVIEQGESRAIDLWEANGRPFLQLAGIGVDAEVIVRVTPEEKKQLGPMSYVKSALKVLVESPPRLEVQTPETDYEGVAVLLGNGRLYGGPAPVFPEASNEDGLLDAVIFEDLSPPTLLRWLRSMAGRDYATGSGFTYFQTTELAVKGCSEEVPFELDGEHLGTSPVQITRSAWPMRVLTSRKK